jgi:putative peptidoglycan lipid II flippase
LVFLKRNPHIAVGEVLRAALLYAAKLIVFSAVATLPVNYLGPRLTALFVGQGRLIAYGLPFFLMGILYAAVGVALLLVSRDKQLAAILKLVKR